VAREKFPLSAGIRLWSRETHSRTLHWVALEYKSDMTDAGIVLASAAVLFTLRVILEQTIVSWVRGVQLSGYFPPQSVLDWIGWCCVILALVWAAAALILSRSAGSKLSAGNRWLSAVIVICFALWWVPYQQWKLLAVEVHGTKNVPRDWLVSAAALGETRLLDYLLADGVDPNSRAQFGESPLGAAAAAGQMQSAKMLLTRAAHLESRTAGSFETPLLEAAQMNHTDMVRLLLDHGANPRSTDVMERTVLDWARLNQNSGMAELVRVRLAERVSDRPASSAARN
jgi:hypothetical protein